MPKTTQIAGSKKYQVVQNNVGRWAQGDVFTASQAQNDRCGFDLQSWIDKGAVEAVDDKTPTTPDKSQPRSADDKAKTSPAEHPAESIRRSQAGMAGPIGGGVAQPPTAV
ncbi:MAG: hypothetical protein AAF663_00060 [Planctomycetota bacterium]